MWAAKTLKPLFRQVPSRALCNENVLHAFVRLMIIGMMFGCANCYVRAIFTLSYGRNVKIRMRGLINSCWN